MTKVPFVQKPVALRKGEHYSEAYKKIDPFSLVPAIDDDGFCLTESKAIAKYVIDKYNLPDHWFQRPQETGQGRGVSALGPLQHSWGLCHALPAAVDHSSSHKEEN